MESKPKIHHFCVNVKTWIMVYFHKIYNHDLSHKMTDHLREKGKATLKLTLFNDVPLFCSDEMKAQLLDVNAHTIFGRSMVPLYIIKSKNEKM